jgi:fatty acid desaturase
MGPVQGPRKLPIPREYYQSSNVFGSLALLSIFGTLILLLVSLPVAWGAGWPWLLAVIVPLLGAYAYKLTIVMHECGHRTLFTNRRANRVVGLICGGFLGASFQGFTDSHWHHHRHCGSDKDGEGEGDYLILEHAGPGQMIRHLLKPLTGVALIGTLRMYSRELFGAASPPASGRDSERDAAATHQGGPHSQFALILVTQLLIATIATGGWQYPWLALVYPATAGTFGLFFSRVRAFAEHVSAGRAEGECFVRSHVPNWFDRVFFYTLNMNLHVEHHLYPQIPACNLPRVRRDLQAAGYLTDAMSSTSILRTIVGRLSEARRLRPAVERVFD